MTIARVFLFSVITLILIIPDEAEGFWGCPDQCFTQWSQWSACSGGSCGGGTRTRSRQRVSNWARIWACKGPCWRVPSNDFTQRQPCNVVCQNGGTASGGACKCSDGFKGQCCESCEEGATVIDKCNDRCTCKDGQPADCVRIRHEFTTLSAERQREYVKAAKKIATDPMIKPAFDDLMFIHRILFPSVIHTKDMFLPWHRYFVLQYENLLRQASDCKVSAIYWDWSVASDTDPWSTNEGDVWYSGDRGIGGKGPCTSGEGNGPCCVRSGVFREGEFSLIPGSAPPACLRRNFTFPPPNSAKVQALLKVTDFEKFESTWRNMHNNVHCAIGGTMCTDDAASAPSFFFHHGFVDKFWGDWQDVSEENKNAHFGSVNHLMPRQGLFPRQLIDLKAQPGPFGPVAVEYKKFPAVNARKRRSPKGPSGAPRPITADERAIRERARRLFNMSPEDIAMAEQTMRELEL